MSLSAQVTASIRQAIREGRSSKYLPSERRLSEYFPVSRPTVCTALRVLAREGLIEIHHGRRSRLLGAPAGAAGTHNRTVGLITQKPTVPMSHTGHQIISEFRMHLAESGFTTEILVCSKVEARAQVRAVEDFVRQNRVSCCLLLSVSREVQSWFAQRSLPALVIGSGHEGIRLPSLDVDYRSVCRHAAGVFLGKGHRSLALVIQQSGYAGDLASERGFREGVAQHAASRSPRAVVVRHTGSARNTTAKLDALFRTAQAPTALLVAGSWEVMAVTIYLLRRGLAVPETVSLIARDWDYLFETVDPQIAHYRFEGNAFPQRVSRLTLKLFSDGHLYCRASSFRKVAECRFTNHGAQVYTLRTQGDSPVALQRQRRFILQPRVGARHERLPWENRDEGHEP